MILELLFLLGILGILIGFFAQQLMYTLASAFLVILTGFRIVKEYRSEYNQIMNENKLRTHLNKANRLINQKKYIKALALLEPLENSKALTMHGKIKVDSLLYTCRKYAYKKDPYSTYNFDKNLSLQIKFLKEPEKSSLTKIKA